MAAVFSLGCVLGGAAHPCCANIPPAVFYRLLTPIGVMACKVNVHSIRSRKIGTGFETSALDVPPYIFQNYGDNTT